jgi:hypothetical protein
MESIHMKKIRDDKGYWNQIKAIFNSIQMLSLAMLSAPLGQKNVSGIGFLTALSL